MAKLPDTVQIGAIRWVEVEITRLKRDYEINKYRPGYSGWYF